MLATCLLACALLIATGRALDVVRVVKDINAQSTASEPRSMVRMGGFVFFVAKGDFGAELYKSDGTTAGTTIVKDLTPGAGGSFLNPAELAVVGSTLFFSACFDTINCELFKSDGTEAGTVLVKDIVDGSGSSSPSQLFAFGGALFFQACEAATGCELYKSDGMDAGTGLFKDINLGSDSFPSSFAEFNGDLYFQACDSTVGCELFKSDGTESNTAVFANIVGGSDSSSPSNLIVFGGSLFFRACDLSTGCELWKTDGVTAPVLVKDIRGGSDSSGPSNFGVFGGKLFFSAFDPATGRELYSSDGTPANTGLFKDINPSGSSSPESLVVFAGSLFFSACEATAGCELFKSDGTPSGTGIFVDVNGGSNSNPSSLTVLDGTTLLFSACVSLGDCELFKTDGTVPGTVIVKNIAGATFSSSFVGKFAAAGNTLFFGACTTGCGLHKSDGTTAGTVVVKEIITGELFAVGSTVFFQGCEPVFGCELYKSDGTEMGTVLVKDISSGTTSSSPGGFVALGTTLFFSACDVTVATARCELYKSDGTESGTLLVQELNPVGDSFPANLVVFNGQVFFSACDGGTNGCELFKTDGSTITLVKDIEPGSSTSRISHLTVVGNKLFFQAFTTASGFELYVSDGTPAGTQLIELVGGSGSSGASSLVAFGGALFFRACVGGAIGCELFKSDGTLANTVLVKDINPGSADSNPSFPTVVNGVLYFRACVLGDCELHKSDGTTAGTVLVKDINPGSDSSSPQSLAAFGGRLFFAAATPTTGRELFKSDGTVAGTVLVKDIHPGSASSSPSFPVPVGDLLFFVAIDAFFGTELFVVDSVCGPALAAGCPPGSYGISTTTHGNFCFRFDSGTELSGDLTAFALTGGCSVTVTGSTTDVSSFDGSYLSCVVTTDAVSGELVEFELESGLRSVRFSQCSSLEFNDGTRKRGITTNALVSSSATFVGATSASGDPHLKGLFGIAFDLFGVPKGTYALMSGPAFQINVQLAQSGPEERYITRVAVLYRGTSFEIDPWTPKSRKAALLEHFAALGAAAQIDGWKMTLELCADVAVTVEARYSPWAKTNFLNVAVSVPGCHDAYGGLLGQTYQCRWATEKFHWSRDMEEAFRVPTLTTPTGTHAADATCIGEDA